MTGNTAPYGQVLNPHNRAHVTGGSSSGAGASVAARIVPAALGGDTVGSVRVPASFNGVVGFKPTPGRWPGDGVAPISHTLDTPGLLARSVGDLVVIDDIVTGGHSTGESKGNALQGVRLAYAPRQHLDLIDLEVEQRFVEVLRHLRDAGAHLVEIDLGEDFATLTERATWRIFFHETMDAVAEFLRENRIPASFEGILDELKPGLKNAWDHMVVPSGGGYSRTEYERAMSIDRPKLQHRYDAVFASGVDGILFPTTPRTAPEIAQQSQFFVGSREVNDLVLAKNTIGGSLAGLPGISLPMGFSSGGLPFGLEIDGPRSADRQLLDVARRLESVLAHAS